jgi:hypothetical protein
VNSSKYSANKILILVTLPQTPFEKGGFKKEAAVSPFFKGGLRGFL